MHVRRPRRYVDESGSTSCGIGLSSSQVAVPVGDNTSNVTGISSFNSVGEDKSIMFKTYRGPLPIHPRRYVLPLGTFRSGDLNVAPSRGE